MEEIMFSTNKKNNRNKYLYFGILGIFLLIGLTYAIVFYVENYESSNLGLVTDLLTFNITEEGKVAIEDARGQKDSDGLNNQKITFTITNNNPIGVRVVIGLVEDENSNLDVNNVRFGFLNNGTVVNVGNLGENNNILYDFFMDKGESVVLQSTIWLDYYYEGGETTETFSGKYVVEASNIDEYGYMYLSNLVGKNKGLYPIKEDGALYDGTGNIKEYRYSGTDPDNYVTFNNELWRIIGVVDGKVKIVKDEEIAQSNYTSNEDYYDSLNEKVKEMVEYSNFYNGTIALTDTYTSLLTNEQTSSIEGYINSINASDYLYSTDITYYTSELNSTNISSNTWLTGAYLTMSPISDTNVLGINENVPTSVASSDTTYNIKPSLYLKKSVSIVNGNGTENKPYQLEMIR